MHGALVIPLALTSTIQQRSLSVVGPFTRNKLPCGVPRMRAAPAGTPKGVTVGQMKKKKREGKTEKEDQERENERDNNDCLPSFLMPLWAYHLYLYAIIRVLLIV